MTHGTERKMLEILEGYEKLPLRLQERINIFFFSKAYEMKIEDAYITERTEEAHDLINEFLTYEA